MTKTDCSMHTKKPKGYIEWHAWAEKKSKTHEQVKCDECGLYSIWIKRENKLK